MSIVRSKVFYFSILIGFLSFPSPGLAQHSVNPHDAGSEQHAEHAAALNLVPHASVTHRAVRSGSWFDTNTWTGGNIPSNDSRVLIPQGLEVIYDGVSNARIYTLRVDGHLRFSSDRDSRLVVDTVFVDTIGTLTIGEVSRPIEASNRVEIIIANNGPIDVSWDPALLSRGLVLHGTTRMHGEKKTVHMKVAVDPEVGDSFIQMVEPPENWRVGDTIVVAGTHYYGYKWDGSQISHFDPEDDVKTISRIEGSRVYLDSPLQFDHSSPREDLKTSVANYTRNIRISSENPSSLAVHERGHIMFMHSDRVDVRFVEFFELGRTDKVKEGRDANRFSPIRPDSNVKGRYPFHFHRTGTGNVRSPGIAVGNAVFKSPGWCFVHHDSNAVFHNNASYDCFGAGYVAETANEIGSWTNNIAIYGKGRSWAVPKNIATIEERQNFDLAKGGSGFYFQGRMVRAVGNIAASVNSGFAYFHRDLSADEVTGMLPIPAETFQFPEAVDFHTRAADDMPILSFHKNEAFGANHAFYIEKANPRQGHDIHTRLTDFTAWSVRYGAAIAYTAHYILENFDLIGKRAGSFSESKNGISLGSNTFDMTIINPRVDNFENGIVASGSFTFETEDNFKRYNLINPSVSNIRENSIEGDFAMFNSVPHPGRFSVSLSGLPLTYRDRYLEPGTRLIDIRGTKVDSISSVNFPEIDPYESGYAASRSLIAQGYYENTDGKRYVINREYFTDRGTLEFHKVGHLVEIHPEVNVGALGAPNLGPIDLNSRPPVAVGESTTTAMERDLVLNVLSNDSDPDGDSLVVEGITPPDHGVVFNNNDGTITYRPDFGFTGEDSFKYWVSDSNGNFTPASVLVDVREVDTDVYTAPRNLRKID